MTPIGETPPRLKLCTPPKSKSHAAADGHFFFLSAVHEVHEEMSLRMDTGVRVNKALAKALL